ncbi:MAG: XRE family transcriptional regulator [Bacteroidetes bacterium]|nr:XRE family transcriptional regulator [Bacteroidota bacterium]
MQKNHGIHIGKLIRKHLKDNGQSVVWFAKQLECDRSKMYRIFNSPIIYSSDLWQISAILKHDFFLDVSSCFSNRKE